MFLPKNFVELQPDAGFVRRPMRVLSLFDGIGTAKHVLDLLGIDIEAYYSSEIDQNAINVTKMHFGDEIIHLGDIRTINHKELEAIMPIDLVIGGSPCNDFSGANPARRGIYDLSNIILFSCFY